MCMLSASVCVLDLQVLAYHACLCPVPSANTDPLHFFEIDVLGRPLLIPTQILLNVNQHYFGEGVLIEIESKVKSSW